jgi:hypothetical protein
MGFSEAAIELMNENRLAIHGYQDMDDDSPHMSATLLEREIECAWNGGSAWH